MKRLALWLRPISRALGSLGLACILLLLLGLLTLLGTLEQAHSGLYEVQRKYFESFVLLHDFGPFSLPLPGANLVLSLLGLNLLVGGVIRLTKRRSTVGILVTHLGILLLLAAGFVKWRYSDEGQMTLYEGERANYFQDPFRSELAIAERRGTDEIVESTVPQEHLQHATPEAPITLAGGGLPFTIRVLRYARHASVLPKGPMFDAPTPVVDGVFLQPRPTLAQAEANIAGAHLQVTDTASGEVFEGLVWAAQAQPWTVRSGGREFLLDLRRERHLLPFSIRLDQFTKIDHPGTTMPRSFESEVTVLESASERAVRISMNEPLRSQGLVVYQASYGPQGASSRARFFSTFAIVRNPADSLPLYACIVIASGLLLHFGRKLRQGLRAQAALR